MFTSQLKKIYSITLGIAMVFGVYTFFGEQAPSVDAQSCSTGQTSGNLFGYLETDNIGYIYLSTESWNDDPLGEGHGTTNQGFSVSYDRLTDRFDGRGWSPYVGWVDFGEVMQSHSTNKVAEFEAPSNDSDSWGNWNPIIDLRNVTYQTDPGGFVGQGYNGDYTYVNDEEHDNAVGSGYVSFENVAIVEPICSQFVSLTLNGQSDIYRNTCPVNETITINWASENVSNCRETSGNWSGPNLNNLPNPYQNGSDYTFTGNVTASSPSDTVTISCIGDNGQTVTDSAQISCGSAPSCDPATEVCEAGGNVIPTYIEV